MNEEDIFLFSNGSWEGCMGKVMLSDTTVQENNITFPTDAKLAKKIIESANKIGIKENIKQRQSYKRVTKQLMREAWNHKHPKRSKHARRATKKLKTIGGRVVRELKRKLPGEVMDKYKDTVALYEGVLRHQVRDKGKVYSLHKPFTACIAKGKVHKQYEFGNKVCLMVGSKRLVITAIRSFWGNPYDSKTIESLLEEHRSIVGTAPEEVVYDRGGRGRKRIGETLISTPSKPGKQDSSYRRRVKRKKFRRRAAIEAVISHLKREFRMAQNYLHGEESPQINAYLASAGWNLMLLMRKLKQELLFVYFLLRKFFSIFVSIFLRRELKVSF